MRRLATSIWAAIVCVICTTFVISSASVGNASGEALSSVEEAGSPMCPTEELALSGSDLSGDKKKRDADEDEEDDEDDEDDSKKKKKKTKVKDPDEAFVRDNIEDFLSPSNIEWLDDGRVEMSFELGEKDEAHEEIFSSKITEGNKSRFRWSFEDEEFVLGGGSGIRISDAGVVFLRAWYVDDVEAEITYLQCLNYSKRHLTALVFGSIKKAIGTNYGTQTGYFARGRMGSARGIVKPVTYNKKASFKLKMKDEVFTAYRDGKKKAERKYKKKSFPSGQIGIVWGGSIAGIIPDFTITGKLDYKKMAAEMKKKKKRSRR